MLSKTVSQKTLNVLIILNQAAYRRMIFLAQQLKIKTGIDFSFIIVINEPGFDKVEQLPSDVLPLILFIDSESSYQDCRIISHMLQMRYMTIKYLFSTIG